MAGTKSEIESRPEVKPRTEAELNLEIEVCNKKIRELALRVDACKHELFEIKDRKILFPETYRDGYTKGLTWSETYVPGGPFISIGRPNLFNNESYEKYNAAYRNHREYMIGFKAGLIKAKNPLSENPALKFIPEVLDGSL